MINDIVILGLLSYESPKYWGLCNKSIQKTISSNSKVRYIIGLDRVDKNIKNELLSYLPNLTTFDISIKPTNIKNGKEDKTAKRVRIGELYNRLYSQLPNDAQYGFMLDGDIAFVCRNWDTILLSTLKEKCVVVGHEYSERWPEKYQHFPCLQCSLFDYQKIKHLKFNFGGTSKDLTIKTQAQSDIFGIPIGSKLNRDIGWEWPLKIKEAGFTGKPLKFISGDDVRSQLLTPKTDEDKYIYKINHKHGIKSLFEFYYDSILIGTHLTKSTCLKYNDHPISKFWINKVEGML